MIAFKVLVWFVLYGPDVRLQQRLDRFDCCLIFYIWAMCETRNLLPIPMNGRVPSSPTSFLIDKSGVHNKTWKNWTITLNWLDYIGPWFKFRARPMFEVAFEVRLCWIREPYTRARGMWGARSGQGRFSCRSQKFWVLRGPLSLKFCQIFHYCPKKIPEPNIFEIPWSFDWGMWMQYFLFCHTYT